MSDVVDAAEQYLDEHGLDRPHLAGNSMGGYMAIELARRGRAATVCALSLGGLWSSGDGLQARAFKTIRRHVALGRLMRPVVPLMSRSATLRRFGSRDIAVHGDRLTAAQVVEMNNDLLACAVVNDLSADAWHIAPLNPLPCPITIAWAEKDTLLPVELYETAAKERLPGATFTILPDVGHGSMVDDPELVARTILAVIGAAEK
jgi:pimeloyl-ACP methyl ester carboxylesterase